MSDSNRPVILLAFANPEKDLNLEREYKPLRAIFESKGERFDVPPPLFGVTAQEVFDIFRSSRYRGRIAIFHYAGHAAKNKLLFQKKYFY